MVNCAACSCTRTEKTKDMNIKFFRFPTNIEQQLKWIEFVNKPHWRVPKTAHLCSQHFHEDCLNKTSSKYILKKGAMPTIREVPYIKSRVLYQEKITKLKLAQIAFDAELSKESSVVTNDETVTPSNADIIHPSVSCQNPQKKVLKRKINHLERENNLTKVEVRKLQKMQWYRRKKISKLKAKLKEVVTNDETVTLTNIDIIQPSLSCKNPQETVLNRKINYLERENNLNNVKVRKLQKMLWNRRNEISNLKEALKQSNPEGGTYNNVRQPEFIALNTNSSSQQISAIDKQTNNVVMFTNVNPIITHKGCSVFMVTAQKDTPQTTSKIISSNELSNIKTEVFIKDEIHEEVDSTLYDNFTDFTENPIVPVTQDETLTPVQTNTSTSILRNVLKTTSNKETLDYNIEPDQTMITSRNNTMSTEEYTTTADKPEEEKFENFAVGVLKKTLEKERIEHHRKVRTLQKTIQRLRKTNEKLMETVKELKLENSLYG